MSPASPDELDLHRRLLSRNDDTASAELFVRYCIVLDGRLRANFEFFQMTDEDISDAITTAWLEYTDRPERYKPEGQSLRNFLYTRAKSRLKDMRRKVRKELDFENSDDEFVEVSREFTDNIVEGSSKLEDRVLDCIVNDELWQKIQELVPDEQDLKIVRLMLDDVRETSAYVTLLKIGHLPENEQRKQVKRVKDRLKKRLQRAGRDKLLPGKASNDE